MDLHGTGRQAEGLQGRVRGRICGLDFRTDQSNRDNRTSHDQRQNNAQFGHFGRFFIGYQTFAQIQKSLQVKSPVS